MNEYIFENSLRTGSIIYRDGVNIPTFHVFRNRPNDDNAKEEI